MGENVGRCILHSYKYTIELQYERKKLHLRPSTGAPDNFKKVSGNPPPLISSHSLEISEVLEAGRGMRLVDSNPNRFTDSNSESMIEFHAYDIESRRLSSP